MKLIYLLCLIFTPVLSLAETLTLGQVLDVKGVYLLNQPVDKEPKCVQKLDLSISDSKHLKYYHNYEVEGEDVLPAVVVRRIESDLAYSDYYVFGEKAWTKTVGHTDLEMANLGLGLINVTESFEVEGNGIVYQYAKYIPELIGAKLIDRSIKTLKFDGEGRITLTSISTHSSNFPQYIGHKYECRYLRSKR